MEKKRTTLRRMSNLKNDSFVPGTPAECIGFVWFLMREVIFMNKQ